MNGDTSELISKTYKIKKMFKFGQENCIYENTQVTEKNPDFGQSSEMKIINHSCRNEENMFEKKVQIKFKDHYLCIKDVYDFGGKNLQGTTLNKGIGFSKTDDSKFDLQGYGNEANKGLRGTGNENQNKKKFIFRKVNEDTHEERKFSRNTKNVAKNCVKAFLQFLKATKQMEVYSRLKKITSETKFNNSLIFMMIKDEKIASIFKVFLKERAEAWIDQSKLFNKEIHREGVKLYLELIDKQNQFDVELKNHRHLEMMLSQHSDNDDQLFEDEEEEQQEEQQEQQEEEQEEQ